MFEAYHVAVRLRLVDHVSHGLTHLSHQFARVHGHSAALQRSLNQIRLTAMTGFAVGATGIFGLMTLRGPYDQAKRFNDEVARFSALGLGDAARREATHFVEAMDEIGTSLTEKMALFRDATTVFRGNLHHAEMVTPTLARMRFAMESLYGHESGTNMDRQFMDLLRVMELRGGLRSEAEAREQMNYAFQALTTSGARVNPQALLAFMQTAGATGRTLSSESLFYSLEPLIQEMGGPRAGTAWQTLASRLSLGRFLGSGGRLAGDEMLRLGLLDRSGVEFTDDGHFQRYRVGHQPLVGQDLLMADPYEWFRTILKPRLEAAGVDSDAELYRTFSLIGGRTGSRILDIFNTQGQAVIEPGIAMARNSMNIDQAYDHALQNTVEGREIAMHNRFVDLQIRLGQAVLPMAIAGMEALIPLLTNLSEWMHRNPNTVRTLTTAFVTLMGAMAIGGMVLLLSAAFRGLGMALSMLNIIGPMFTAIRWLVMLNPWVTGIVLLGAAFVGLYAAWTPFRNVVDGVLGFLGRLFGISSAEARVLPFDLSDEDGRDPEHRVLSFGEAMRGFGVAASLGLGPILAMTAVFWTFKGITSLLGLGLRMLIPALTGFVAIIGWPATLIIALTAAVVGLGVWLYNNVEPFRTAVDGIIGALGRMLNWLGEQARSLGERFGLVDGDGRITSNGRTAASFAISPALGLFNMARDQFSNDNEATGASRFVRRSSSRSGAGGGDVILDGRRVGEFVSRHQANAMRGPQAGISTADPSIAPAPRSMPYAAR